MLHDGLYEQVISKGIDTELAVYVIDDGGG